MAILPLPTVPFFDPITKQVHSQWVEFFKSIEDAVPTNLPPLDARYVVTTNNATLTNEVNLGAMASGLLRQVVGAGIATLSTVPFTGLTTDFLRGDAVFAPLGPGSGDVVGPGSAVADRIATFNGTTGKLIKDGGQTIAQAIAAASLTNGATAVVANAVDTYLTGSNLPIGGRIKAGTVLAWRLAMTKTAAGTATPTFAVRFGTAGTTSDTARITFTGPAQTAATDTGWCDLSLVVGSVGASATVTAGTLFTHTNTTTGLSTTAQPNVQTATSATFDNTSASLVAGVSVNPGASGVWTFQVVSAQATNLV